MKVIFVSSNPYYPKQDENMYVDEIEKRYSIEKWELSKLYGWENYIVSNRPGGVVRIQSLDDLDERLSKESSCVIISLILIPQLSVIAHILKKYGVYVIYIAKEDLGSWLCMRGENEYGDVSLWRKIKIKAKSNFWIRKLFNQLRYKNTKYKYTLGTYNFFPEMCENFCKIHHVAYEDYLRGKKSETLVDGNYILFVDGAFVHHPMYTGLVNSIDEGRYLEKMRGYFDFLESKFAMPVVVSAHPKTRYSKGAFGDRDVIMYKTPQLIQHCKYVVSHYSTSLYQAVLLKKPIAILTSKDLEMSAARITMFGGIKLSQMINADLVDLDVMSCPSFAVDDFAYEKFKSKYLVNIEKQQMSNGELVLEFLQKLER